MEGLFSYFESHYIMFIILSVLMLFAVIGYFAKKKSDKEQPYKLADENALAEKELENIAQNVNKNASIKDFMQHNATYQNQANPAPSQPVAQTPVNPQVQDPVSRQPVFSNTWTPGSAWTGSRDTISTSSRENSTTALKST